MTRNDQTQGPIQKPFLRFTISSCVVAENNDFRGRSVDGNMAWYLLEDRSEENVAQLDLVKGKRFEARQKPFAEFELSTANDRILRIVYAHNPKLEEQGGCSYKCEYESRIWELQTFQTRLLGRESYRVLCEGELAASSGAWKMFGPVEIKYADGSIWRGRRRMLVGTVVDDHAGKRIAHSWPKPGRLFAGSSIWVDSLETKDRTLALLLILLHLTAHSKE